MKSSALDYDLPPGLIAQRPTERRDASRLLVYDRSSGAVRHRTFGELREEVGDALVVVNDTRVVPARIRLEQPRGEVLLVERRSGDEWEGLARPTRRLRPGRRYGEGYSVSPFAWQRICEARRLVAVGTTTVRVLETIARGAPLAGRTDLFVTPGFEFRCVGSLLTNFHLPRSTLLALVMAFAGIEKTRELYRLAIAERYRFYSFGDAMLLL